MFSYRHIHAQTRRLSNCKHSSTIHVCIAQNIRRLYLPIHETNLLINRVNKSFCNETEEIKNNTTNLQQTMHCSSNTFFHMNAKWTTKLSVYCRQTYSYFRLSTLRTDAVAVVTPRLPSMDCEQCKRFNVIARIALNPAQASNII